MNKPVDPLKLIREMCRQDLTTFIHWCFQVVDPGSKYLHNWHIDAIAWALSECWHGNIKRLVITVPPRNLKSICATVSFPAWVLGQDPTTKIIAASYSGELAAKHSRDSRAVMSHPFYRSLFPMTRLSSAKNTEFEFETTMRGYRLATSVGGTLTGRGGNIIVLDDIMNPDDAASEVGLRSVNRWFEQTLYSRLNNKNEDVIIIVQQRLHVDDLVGIVLEQGGWVHLNLPAIAQSFDRIPIGPNLFHTREPGDILHPARESERTLRHIRKTIGSYAFSGQYLQNPVPMEGEIVKWEWFTFGEFPEEFEAIVQSWDTAMKPGAHNDYSVCTTWGVKDRHAYLIDLYRAQLNYPDLKRAVKSQFLKHQPERILIEDAASGTSLLQDLHNEPGMHCNWVKPDRDKLSRLVSVTALIESGQVILQNSAPWMDDFRSELLQFPNGRHDDQVDSMSQFLNWFKRSWLRPGPRVRY